MKSYFCFKKIKLFKDMIGFYQTKSNGRNDGKVNILPRRTKFEDEVKKDIISVPYPNIMCKIAKQFADTKNIISIYYQMT